MRHRFIFAVRHLCHKVVLLRLSVPRTYVQTGGVHRFGPTALA
jgi:hypothetical protein